MSFRGFPPGKMRWIRLPEPFFRDLLPQIDDLDELKVTLYLFWRLEQMSAPVRFLRLADFLSDPALMDMLAGSEKRLQAALEKAVVRGTLLLAEVPQPDGPLACYFLNTPRGRAAVDAIRQGTWQPTAPGDDLPSLALERPNIFALYEEHIGPLTPLIADALKEAEQTYPADWIEEAFRIAVENNVRRWRYIAAILDSWQREGRDERKPGGDSTADRRKYLEGPFADYIER